MVSATNRAMAVIRAPTEMEVRSPASRTYRAARNPGSPARRLRDAGQAPAHPLKYRKGEQRKTEHKE